MRYPASEKLEIIRLVERSHLPAKQTLDMLGVPRTTFYRWYAHYRLDGEAALQDKAPLPGRVWNRIPDTVRDSLITLALERPELSPRELAVTFTDSEGYFVSESSVYRLLKAHDLITSPAFIVMKAANEFKDKTTRILSKELLLRAECQAGTGTGSDRESRFDPTLRERLLSPRTSPLVMSLLKQDLSHPALRIRRITRVAGYQVDVDMEDALPRCRIYIDAHVIPVGVEFFLDCQAFLCQ